MGPILMDHIISQGRIIGGNETSLNKFPFVVHLNHQIDPTPPTTFTKTDYFCGGTILNSLFILTAAHCLTNIKGNKIKVVAGDHDRSLASGKEQCRTVSHFYIHPEFKNVVGGNDIALLVLDHPFKFNDFVQPVQLSSASLQKELINETATVLGWGKTESRLSSRHLRFANLPLILQRPQCQLAYQKINSNNTILPTQICAGGKKGIDSCNGDSGGLLMCRKLNTNEQVQCGIVSHGTETCGIKGVPGIYTDVFSYLSWIREIIYKQNPTRGKCDSSHFYCPEDNKCIFRQGLCNGKRDCSKGSDEVNCIKTIITSLASDFICDNGLIVDKSWECDGLDGCGDGSDELKCPSPHCQDDQFLCNKGSRCIPWAWHCDGVSDCEDSSDELQCLNAAKIYENLTPKCLTTRDSEKLKESEAITTEDETNVSDWY